MNQETLHGGPHDGRVIAIPDGVASVHVPMIRSGGPGGSGIAYRSLSEMESEVRFDPETWAIIAPPDLVLEAVTARYVRTKDGFVYSEEAAS